MKKIYIAIILLCVLGLTACNTKAKQEALAQTTEVASETGEIIFDFNGYWSLMSKEELKKMNINESQVYDLIAENTQTGTNISIIYDNLKKTEGGTLVRIDDYVDIILENLKNSSENTYICSEISDMNLHGEEYKTFFVQVVELGAEQHFYIRRIEDQIMIMMITLYGEDTVEDILKLSK